jgi:ATP-binding cassette subfamily B protein RaxB
MARRTPCIQQSEAAECGLACLAMVASHHGHETDLNSLRRQHPGSLKGMTLRDMVDIADRLKLAGRAVRLEPAQLDQLVLPAILHWGMTHFVVLVRAGRDGGAVLHDPAEGERRVSAAEIDQHFSGVALEISPAPGFRRTRAVARLRLTDLLGSLRGLGGPLAQVVALSVLLQLYVVASPFYLQLAVDEGVGKDDRSLLATLLLGFGLLAAINAGAGLLRSWLLAYTQATLGLAMGTALCRYLLRLPLGWFERRHTGDLVSRFGSLDPIRNLLAEGMLAALVDGVMALLTSVMVLVYSVKLGLIVLCALALYVALRAACYPAMRRDIQRMVVAQGHERSNFIETARAIQSIKVFNGEAGRLAMWSNRYGRVLSAAASVERRRGVFRALNDVVFGAENLAVVYVGAGAVMDGTLSLGMLFAFMAYKQQFIDRAARLVEKAIEARVLDVHLDRLADIALADAEAPPPTTRAAPPLRGEIELRGVCFSYAAGEQPVLRDVNCRIAAGEYVAITGRSGGGKTTLLKVLLGLLPATKGEVLFDGTPLGRLNLGALRDQIGVVMQDDTLLSGSIGDNIAFFADRPDHDHIRQCAELAGVDSEIAAMPMGYDSLIGDMGSFLSGGQRQRVLLARALYRRPRILVMDEGTSHLDLAMEARVNEAIAALGLTRIIVAHRPQTIASADRVLVFEAGCLREAPRPAVRHSLFTHSVAR